MTKLEKLAINHGYYCSQCNFYSNEPQEKYETMSDFLDNYEDSDVDMNLCFRWDIRKEEDTNSYDAEVFLILQRKGIFKPIYIEIIKEEECNRFEKYLSKHWETLNRIWKPFSVEIIK